MSKLIKNKFTSIPNCVFDLKISAKAIGIYAYLMSRPDDWEFYIQEIVTHFRDGIGSVRSGLKELEESGLLVRTRSNKSDGTFVYDYQLLTEPHAKIPHTENPHTVETASVQLHTTNTDKTLILNTPTTSSTREKFSESSIQLALSNLIEKKIVDSGATWRKRTGKQLQQWASEIDKMHRIDGHSYGIIFGYIHACFEDNFWKNIVRSAPKLRQLLADGKLLRLSANAEEIAKDSQDVIEEYTVEEGTEDASNN